MIIRKILVAIMFQIVLIPMFAQSKTKLEIKDNWYYINGEKFFIKAIGYEIGARPGQHPYQGAKVVTIPFVPGASFRKRN